MKRILLASGSPRRKELLTQMGCLFEVCKSEAEEVITSTNPEEVVMELSSQKGEDVFSKTTGDVCVIGADTVVAVDGNILGKPADEEDAVSMLKKLQGNSHFVYTGVSLFVRENQAETKQTFFEKTEVVFYPMSEEEIKTYVQSKEPMDKAGAYAIQGLCAKFIKEIRGDYYNVVGMPISRLYQEVKNMGMSWKDWENK